MMIFPRAPRLHARLDRYRDVSIPDSVLSWWQRIAERRAYRHTGGLG
ncbi:MAG: hypothetical protein OXR73_11420 [Myxococcales bacterium]|nr:hypothetical protein [Myxococcales bacterium]